MTPTTRSRSQGSSRTPSWAEPLLRVPYLWRGRCLYGADCYGLVRLGFRLRAGIELPRLDDQPDRTCVPDFVRDQIALGWRPVALREAKELDVVTLDGDAGVGLVLAERLVLTTTAETGPLTLPLWSAQWAQRVSGCYRHPCCE